MAGKTRTGPNVQIVLTCDECGKVSRPQPWSRGTKMGVFRLVGGVATGWYIDGGRVFCGEHVPAELRGNRAQSETWGEYDRRVVEDDIEYEAWTHTRLISAWMHNKEGS